MRIPSAAIEQMILRIRALPTRPELCARQDVGSGQPSMAIVDQSQSISHSVTNSNQDGLTPAAWENDLLLDDIWSMMDWNVGFRLTADVNLAVFGHYNVFRLWSCEFLKTL